MAQRLSFLEFDYRQMLPLLYMAVTCPSKITENIYFLDHKQHDVKSRRLPSSKSFHITNNSKLQTSLNLD